MICNIGYYIILWTSGLICLGLSLVIAAAFVLFICVSLKAIYSGFKNINKSSEELKREEIPLTPEQKRDRDKAVMIMMFIFCPIVGIFMLIADYNKN